MVFVAITWLKHELVQQQMEDGKRAEAIAYPAEGAH